MSEFDWRKVGIGMSVSPVGDDVWGVRLGSTQIGHFYISSIISRKPAFDEWLVRWAGFSDATSEAKTFDNVTDAVRYIVTSWLEREGKH